MFGRMDRRYAPAECARLGKYLTDHGYIVTEGDLGPGSAVPSSVKVQELIGSSQPLEWNVDFDNTSQLSNRLRGALAQNEFGFVGSGTVQIMTVDHIEVGRVTVGVPIYTPLRSPRSLSRRAILKSTSSGNA
jgi:hypothetical protein